MDGYDFASFGYGLFMIVCSIGLMTAIVKYMWMAS